MFTSDTENKPTLRCPQCEYTTKFQHHFKQHLTFHRQRDEGVAGIEQCRECCKFFDSKKALKNHVKIHSDDTLVHACDKCGKRFRDTSNLKVHLLTHSGVKPFQCALTGCNYACTTKQWLQRHYRGKHKLTNEEMPPITRQIPFTIEAYTKAEKSKISKPIDENNNSMKMDSDNSSSSFDQEMMYSPASQSASSTYSPASYSGTSVYSPASQSMTPTYPQSPVPTSGYTPVSQPATPSYQQTQTPTSFAELFFATPMNIKAEQEPVPSPTYQAQRSPEEGLVPQQMHRQEQSQPTSVMHPEMIKCDPMLQKASVPQEDILPIFTLPLSQIPEVTNHHQQQAVSQAQPTPPPQSHTTQSSTPTSSKTTSLPPPPPYSHAHSPVDTSYSLAISTNAQSFLEQLGEMAPPPPSYYEALSNVYPQYPSTTVPTNELQPEYTKVSSAYYDNQVVPTSIQRDVQFVDL